MSKADRLLLILNLIRARKNLRAKDLAKECGVTERTIYRDITAISSANIPIYFENGYKFLTDAFLPALNFSLDEYLALYIGLNSEAIHSDPALRKSGKTALAKLESVTPENIKDDYHEIRRKVGIECKGKNEEPKDRLILSLLIQALSKDTKIELRLTSEKSTEIVKDVLPEKLLYKDSEWFLIATIESEKKTIPLTQIRGLSI